MALTFFQNADFAGDWDRLKLDAEDLRHLENVLIENPEAGKVMAGTGALRKIRFAPPRWRTGKSGSLRICYLLYRFADTVIFVMVFAKSQADNLTNEQKNAVKAFSATVERELRKKYGGK